MPSCRPLVLIAFAAFLAMVLGCSGGSNTVTPADIAGSSDNIPVIGMSDANGIVTATGIMGSYQFVLDQDSMTADLSNMRSSAIGEDYIVSGIGFFTMKPCASCLKLAKLVAENGLIKATFNISHPFKPGDPLKPPTAINRLDLDVFDTALVVAPSEGTPQNYALTGATAYSTVCANASGYTTELAGLTADTAAYPYFLVIDDSKTGTSTNNKLAMGAENVQFDVFFNMGGAFDLYLTMGYGASAKKAQRLTPKYYIPEFNRKPAWKVDVVLPNGTNPPVMGNTWDDIDSTTEYDVLVKVYDWQQNAVVTADPATYADETDTTKIWAASTVTGVSMEIPGMYNTLKSMTTADSGTGAPNDPMLFNFKVANENALAAGTYYGLVKVTDSRVPLTPTDGRDFLIDSPDGILLNNYEIPDYMTYQVFPAIVVVGCGPITGSITNPVCPVTGVFNGMSKSFTATAASANGGDPIVLYEWDKDYDGVTFDVDGTGQTAFIGPFDNPNCGGTNDPMTFTVAVRATDSCDPPNVTIFATCELTVDECDVPPIHSIQYEPMPDATDTWHDVAVQPGGVAYIVADVNATGNVGYSRTCVRYDNNLTNYTVINSGSSTGMNDPTPGSWSAYGCDTDGTDVNRVDVTDAGYVITNTIGSSCCLWQVTGSTASSIAGGEWRLMCGLCPVVIDVFQTQSTTCSMSAAGYAQTVGCSSPEWEWSLGFADSNPYSYCAYNYVMNILFTGTDNMKSMQGLSGTNNGLMFYSSSTAAYLQEVGPIYGVGGDLAIVGSQHGSLGMADGQFTGGLDVSIDGSGNIVTLEDNGGGVFRFQKFDSAYTWLYTSPWVDAGDPIRMDFDRSDNEMYLISSTGIHVMAVQ